MRRVMSRSYASFPLSLSSLLSLFLSLFFKAGRIRRREIEKDGSVGWG